MEKRSGEENIINWNPFCSQFEMSGTHEKWVEISNSYKMWLQCFKEMFWEEFSYICVIGKLCLQPSLNVMV